MKAASLSNIKRELKEKTHSELLEYCLSLARFKKENKELLTYIIFEKDNEQGFVDLIKEDIDEAISSIASYSPYMIKKQLRKILKEIKKNIRFSKNKETEVQLLLHFIKSLKQLPHPHKIGTNIKTGEKIYIPFMKYETSISNMFGQQVKMIRKAIDKLEEDLQFDYTQLLNEILD